MTEITFYSTKSDLQLVSLIDPPTSMRRYTLTKPHRLDAGRYAGGGPVKTALIIVDVQNDFADPTGSLYVTGGEKVAEGLARAWRDGSAPFDVDVVVATRDWHDAHPGTHFDEWPIHCVATSWGARLHPTIEAISGIDEFFNKGRRDAAYSGFEGANELGCSLDAYLKGREVTHVTVVGLATDYCVKATALDAMSLGLRTTLDLAFCAGVAPSTSTAAVADMRTAGVLVKHVE